MTRVDRRDGAAHRARSPSWSALLLFALFSLCQCQRTRSAVLVRVETDFTFGETGEARGLRIRVGSGSGVTAGWRDDTAYPLVGPRPTTLPFRAAVLPLADDASRVVTVEVWLCSTPNCDPEAGRTGPDVLVEQRAIFSFV